MKTKEPSDTPTRKRTARFRFYAELNDFLPADKRQREFVYPFRGNPSVKDAVEAIGVPHPEVDLIIVDDASVGFDYRLQPGDVVAVYPVFESLDISPIVRLRPRPLRETRFVLDGHLGKLARYLRLLGFDCAYDRDAKDADIVRRQQTERRIILTRDRGLLKAKAVTHGYCVRSTRPEAQMAEVVERFDLSSQLNPFTRCLVCNGEVAEAGPDAAAEAPPRVRRRQTEFYRCADCGKVYWKGTHYDRLSDLVRRAAATKKKEE